MVVHAITNNNDIVTTSMSDVVILLLLFAPFAMEKQDNVTSQIYENGRRISTMMHILCQLFQFFQLFK